MHDALLGGVNTLVKSLNQLTKNELIDLVKDREVVIADLNAIHSSLKSLKDFPYINE